MINSKLLEILKTFSRKDLKKLQLFVTSELFNSNKNQYNHNCFLLDYIIKFAPKYQNEKLNKEAAFQLLFPNKSYNKRVILNLMSNLVKLVEDFIVFTEFKEYKIKKKLALLNYYNFHQLARPSNDTVREIIAIQENTVYKDSNMYLYDYKMAEQSISLPVIRKEHKPRKDVLQQAIHKLDNYYLITQLSYYCFVMNNANILQTTQQQFPILEKILTQKKTDYYKKDIVISLYYEAAQMLRSHEDNEKHFQCLKKLLHTHTDKLPKLEIRNLYTYMETYCSKKYKEGKEIYFEELYELYNRQITRGILDTFLPSAFKNIVTTGLKRGDLDIVEQFIKNNIDKVTPDYRQETYHYNYAHLCFYKKAYKEVVDLLVVEEIPRLKIRDFKDIYYQINARQLLLKTYYEWMWNDKTNQLVHLEHLLKLLNLFQQFLWQKRKVITTTNLNSHKEFREILEKLCKTIMDSDQYKFPLAEHIVKLKESVAISQKLTEREWLQAKVSLLHKLLE